MQEDIFKKFIDKIKAEKTPEEAEKFLMDLTKFSAAELYFAIMSELSEDDMQAVEQITDDALAQEEIKKRFQQKTQMAPEEFIAKLRDRISAEYLNPSSTE